MSTTNQERITFLDAMRVIACFMVILVHSCEFFYVDYITEVSLTADEVFWSSVIDSAIRACVPIFVMVSSYLLLPLKEGASLKTFFTRRFSRVLIPFVVWSLAYATLPVLWGGMSVEAMKSQLTRLIYNFNLEAGHLWYIYMFIGVYLIMPVISPWLRTAKKSHIQGFLVLWFISTFHHYAKYLAGDEYGIFGECLWNEFTPLFYFSGFIGYIVLAYYIRTYINWDTKKSVAVGTPIFLAGWAISYFLFEHLYPTGDGYLYEMPWRFCTPNCVMTTFALFIMMKKINIKNGKLLGVVTDISKLSYGIYLAHIFVLGFSYKFFSFIESVPLKIFVIALSAYVGTYVVVKILSFLPKSKYIVG